MVTVRRPHARACASDGNHRSIAAPETAEPTSAATPEPYPGTESRVPSGITLGSTATTPQPAARPVAVAEPRQRGVERLGAEEDGERVRVALLVELPQPRAELGLRGGGIVAGDV